MRQNRGFHDIAWLPRSEERSLSPDNLWVSQEDRNSHKSHRYLRISHVACGGGWYKTIVASIDAIQNLELFVYWLFCYAPLHKIWYGILNSSISLPEHLIKNNSSQTSCFHEALEEGYKIHQTRFMRRSVVRFLLLFLSLA